ncbi:MAG: transcription-repair coupling factor [Anaerolineales bacterium]|nr:MAG: transcription-repair coupling factor [Anaerolineales bacterium]
MKLDGLLALIRGDQHYRSLLQRAHHIGVSTAAQVSMPAGYLGLPEAARPCVIAALQAEWPGPIVVVSARPENARNLADQVQAWSQDPQDVLHFQAPDAVFFDRVPWDRSTLHARASVLSSLIAPRGQAQDAGRGTVITVSGWALMVKSVPPMAVRRAVRTLRVGDSLPLYGLLKYCVEVGYESVPVVEEPGTFCHRGSIVDVFPRNLPEPLRIDFFGDEIDSIRVFNPGTQRSRRRLEQATLVPASEAISEWGKAARPALESLDLSGCDRATRLDMGEEWAKLVRGEPFRGIEYYLPYLYPRPSTLLDFLPANALVLVDDPVSLETCIESLAEQAVALRSSMVSEGQLPGNYAVPYFEWEEIRARLASRHALCLGHGPDVDEVTPFFGRQTFMPAPRYGGQLERFLEDVVELRSKGHRVVVISRQAERLSDLLRGRDVYCTPNADLTDVPRPGSVRIVDGIIAEGWAFSPGRLVVLTDAEVFGWSRMRRRRLARRRRMAPESFFSDLNKGDYVVHVEYGIGCYQGMVRKTIGELQREYLEIEYAGGDQLYVPIHLADRINRYLGAGGRVPRMHRLGSSEWRTVRAKAERAVRDIAAGLLELYAAREITPGHAFAPDTDWQRELEASFPYEETDDQIQALAELKADMEKPKPMDRLICGDVGYGKTEVALRAAFKAVMDGKQVAVLVPTTVLAQQHYYTFRRRLRAFPVMVEMLSRFRSPQEQQQVVRDLAAGRVDIVIGTHRLLSNDVVFKDLGLLIIDEEQRFGVVHKEHLKQMRREVDVLTLTATPIPRTLHLALGKVRDMSIIDTPPEDRLAVRTFVSEYDHDLVRRAVLREIGRGGQIYYVHNRVYDIDQVAEELHRIVPEASLTVGHGQMDEDELAQVMLGFAQGEHDILLCTTIIESGLDIPNVNTIIIDRTENLGLSQIYQLRGRVGRGVNRAYAYLFYKRPLTDLARKRLQTIQEATELGAGFHVAMRDLEIRGAGEILGAEQHGHIAAIGFDLYCRLLEQAVRELREASGEPMAAIHRAQHAVATASAVSGLGPSIDLPIAAYLPEEYMPESQLRLRFYRRMARIDAQDEVEQLAEELNDRFGELTEPVTNLFYILRVRALAAEAGVQSIRAHEKEIALSLALPLLGGAAKEITSQHPGLRVSGTRIWLAAVEDWRVALLELLQSLCDLSLLRAQQPAVSR